MSSQVLQLDDVCFYYSQESPVFENVCISANMESRVCIVSTCLLRALNIHQYQ